MKNYLALLIFCILTFNINAQIVEYRVSKSNVNTYDTDMQSYNGWKGWVDNEKNINLYFSQNIFKKNINVQMIGFDPWAFVYYMDDTDVVYTIIADEPTENFPFRKKVKIKLISTVSTSKGSRDQFVQTKNILNGAGYIYSNETFDKLLSGTSIDDIYIFYEMEDGSKGYEAYNIKSKNAIANDASAEQRQIEQEEAANERERLKREKRSETINSLGSSIIKLLKK